MKKMVSTEMLRGISVSLFLLLPLFLKSQVLQVLIDEVMFKPSSGGKLPAAEYIELYNTTDFEIDISGWKLVVGKTLKPLSSLVIAPREYVIVVAAKDSALFWSYGKVAVVSSLSLNNTSQFLGLYDAHGNSVHVISYNVEWMPDEKRIGGISLEMKDLSNPCAGKENWTASLSPDGGTPGRPNASAAIYADNTPPQIWHVVNPDSLHIRLFFEEKMLPQTLTDPTEYLISDGVNVTQVTDVASDWQSVTLLLDRPLQKGTLYTVRLTSNACDCVGNGADETFQAEFGRSERTDSSDIVINELLFHPYAGGSDFVEIYNRSDKILDLKDLYLSSLKSDGSTDTGKRVAPNGFQLLPHHYCCLSAKLEAVSTFYEGLEKGNCWEMSALPAYANASGRVILLSMGKVIDDFAYTESMHYPLLVSSEGVSLEKIHPDLESGKEENWHSAASSVGYATPGQPNSCYSEYVGSAEECISLESTLFSPDGDGYQDILKICYHMPEAGCRANAWVYNINGQCVMHILNNELLGIDGLVCWDGIMENQLEAPAGCYLLLFEYWSLSGKVERLKKVITVAGK